VEGLAFVYFDESDVVRHHLVQRIIPPGDHRLRRRTADVVVAQAKAEGRA
jgi:phosphate starvation-inducible protein PhoH